MEFGQQEPFSREVTVFHGRWLPIPVGYAEWIYAYDLNLPMPITLTAIGIGIGTKSIRRMGGIFVLRVISRIPT